MQVGRQLDMFADCCPHCHEPYQVGSWPLPCNGKGHELGVFWRGDAQVHTSEKVVVYENPRTGEVRIPGRGDRPIHPKLAACGFERKTLDTIADVRALERKTGTIHEQSNYSPNSSLAAHDTGSVG